MNRTAYFGVSKEDGALIARITDRAIDLMFDSLRNPYASWYYIERDLITCCASGCPLYLAELLAADDTEFINCIVGIGNGINKETGEIGDFDCYRPAFAKLQ